MKIRPMAISVLTTQCYLHNLTARMPFRYGIASLTTIPYLFLSVQCEIDGKIQDGVAADGLIPKWFTKDPMSTYRDDVKDMLQVIETACSFAKEINPVTTVFDLWQAVYLRQRDWGNEVAHPPLLWGFGLSLLERAVIDAYCRAENISLVEALQNNSFGIRLDEIHPELVNYQPSELLPAEPLDSLTVRHTVGLSDPLSEDDIPDNARVLDGLPQSLQTNLAVYGLTHLKIKLSGDISQDMKRLKQIKGLLDAQALSDYAFTLDGNEQFHNVYSFQVFWSQLNTDKTLAPLLDHLLYVEQPLQRDAALCPTTQEPLRRWADRPVMIIDESDDQLDSVKIALDCGYSGTSHKNCKGIFKGIANACLLEYLRRSNPSGTYILSGEDLVNIAPVALLQDLAMMANLGIEHVERNGHHYFSGLSMFPDEIQDQMIRYHPDLYQRSSKGFATLQITRGKISLKSVNRSAFGSGFDFDLSSHFLPKNEWQFMSMQEKVIN